MSDDMKRGIAEARRKRLQQIFPRMAGFFRSEEERAEIARAEEQLKREEADRRHREYQATFHPRYNEIQLIVSNLEDRLRHKAEAYEEYYKYSVLLATLGDHGNRTKFYPFRTDTPIDMHYDEYVSSISDKLRYRHASAAYSYRQPFLFFRFEKTSAISIGYNPETQAYIYHQLDGDYETETRASSMSEYYVNKNRGFINGFLVKQIPDFWYIKQTLPFKTPEDVEAQFEKDLQQTIANEQLRTPWRITRIAAVIFLAGGLIVKCTPARSAEPPPPAQPLLELTHK